MEPYFGAAVMQENVSNRAGQQPLRKCVRENRWNIIHGRVEAVICTVPPEKDSIHPIQQHRVTDTSPESILINSACASLSPDIHLSPRRSDR